MSDPCFHSRLAVGRLRHRRFLPRWHAFDYRVWMLWLDLDELPALLARTPGFGTRRGAPARFRREDYLAPHELPLADAVRARLTTELGSAPTGPVRMLSQIRLFGVLFNPLTLYYAYDAHGRLRAVLAEVTNTPWRERQVYACRVDPERHSHRAEFDKRLHVSPFNPMEMRYYWRFNTPRSASSHCPSSHSPSSHSAKSNGRLMMHMETWHEEARHFDATLTLTLKPATRTALVAELIKHPGMTLKTLITIHWQALRLWLKRTPIHDHPGRETPSS
ncbi:DUF1365 domain-containing protein [Salinicola socius]|uniref:DUF1365 domain-containing protein n=1 Tax=Salinicola socius TaxID=404433 RepID=A0A1Q8SRW5_9GAMM|nr:DUF1365 domain-containing protein [Salinicola socius]OLO04144.1 hypothetical protein BTW07_10975 [Salinicola socius]